ncbi:phosphate ABC transporter substrate-binding protein PstS [Luteococcus sp. Sow4_B9]|uniref:phosphate ABC transporter substrate-binding protein PstS n=1 Tax=Luteococcus sp. Sow4_B9 TaxID=3438792 RepID=UPI003F98DD0E
MLGSPDNGVPVLKTEDARRRRLIMPLFVLSLVALLVLGLLWNRGNDSKIVGAGSTLAAPLIERSATSYRNAFTADNPERPDETGGDWVLDGSGLVYEPVGSMGGIMRLNSDPEVDFAVSDYPLAAETVDGRKLGQFPIAAGAIAVVHNLDLGGKQLQLDAQTVANIYLGTVKRWDDKAIAALNPGVALPAQDITPVHRADGSGSTQGITNWLSTNSPQWNDGPGTGPAITWPQGVGSAAERSSGVVKAVKATSGAVGYVEPGQARAAGLKVATLRNGAGDFVAPASEGMAAALAGMDWNSADHFTRVAPSADATGAYPLTVPIYVVMEREPQQEKDARRALSYLDYVVTRYDASASKLGYLPLPEKGATQVDAYIKDTFPYAP